MHAITVEAVRENEFTLLSTFPERLVMLSLSRDGFVVGHLEIQIYGKCQNRRNYL